MLTPRRHRGAAGQRSGPEAPPQKSYSAALLGDGHVLPIVERLGRRLLREIDPLSSEGRALLRSGRVTLWCDDGARAETAPIEEMLDRLRSTVRRRKETYATLPRWTAHYEDVLKSIGRMKRSLKPRR